MRGKQFIEEQIIAVLKGVGSPRQTPELCWRHGVSEQTFYRWQVRYGGLELGGKRGGPPPDHTRVPSPAGDAASAPPPG
jgi:hypothetical protein